MKKIIVIFVLILFVTSPALAVMSSGEINEKLSYKHLKIDKSNNKNFCVVSGEIINETDEFMDGVTIKMYALDMLGHFLWSEILFFSTLPPGEGINFADPVSNCKSGSPYEIRWKVQY